MATQVTLDQIMEYMKRWDWRFDRGEDGMLRTGFKGRNGSYRVVIQFREDRDLLTFVVPNLVTSGNRRKSEICEALMHINFQLILGRFCRDRRDGEIRFELSLPLEDNDLSYEQFCRALGATCATVDSEYPVIMRLLYSDVSVEEALEEDKEEGKQSGEEEEQVEF